ncbi:MAG: hypothetical protein R3F56_16975 [Planctomycetota bacterium]
MDGLTLSLVLAALGVAFVHTALGPDHYVPFVMLARARAWSLRRTLWITAVCGAGHVLSSLLLGTAGLAAGVALGRLENVETHRGALAAWLLFGLGLAYGLWGLRHALRQRQGVVLHAHSDHLHLHGSGTGAHHHGHLLHHHHHRAAAAGNSGTFWTLFLVFVLGPCEPLIPLFMVPASEQRWGTALVVGGVFAVVTIATMLAITTMAMLGAARLHLPALERWTHALAGGVIACSAAAVLFLGA